MAKKTKPTFTDTPSAELAKLRAEKREELRALRFSSAGSRAKDVNAPKSAKKVIARIETELSKRRLAAVTK
jgi:ribosomal protein L29